MKNIVKGPLKAQQEYNELFKRMWDLCKEHEWGDPFSYARSREIHMANHLGHTIASTYSGADAIDDEGNEVEYKTTIGDNISASYTGISNQETWELQEKYLREEKLAKYPYHYIARYKDGEIKELWRLTGMQVFNILLPKFKIQYESKIARKDPRLSKTLTKSDIMSVGTRLM